MSFMLRKLVKPFLINLASNYFIKLRFFFSFGDFDVQSLWQLNLPLDLNYSFLSRTTDYIRDIINILLGSFSRSVL